MTDQTLLRKLKGRVTADIYHLFEKRLGLGESSPAHGCGDAERRNDHKPTDLSHGSAVVEAEDGEELQRIIDFHLTTAAEHENNYVHEEKSGISPFARYHKEQAANHYRWAAYLTELGSDPRTMSVAGEDEVCECKPGYFASELRAGVRICYGCGNARSTLSRRKRSGLHNGEAVVPLEAGESEE